MSNAEATAQAAPDTSDPTMRDDRITIERVMIRALTDRCIALERTNVIEHNRWAQIAERYSALRARVHAGETITRFDLDAWQAEVFAWEQKNFGEQPEYRRVYGVMEELGELCHARLKAEQGIRLSEDHAAKAKDAVGDMLVFLANFCSLNGWSLEEIIAVTWAEVSQRDWTKNKESGASEAPPMPVPAMTMSSLVLLDQVKKWRDENTAPTFPNLLQQQIDDLLARAGNVMREAATPAPTLPPSTDGRPLDPRIFDAVTQTQIDASRERVPEPVQADPIEPDDPNAGHGGYDWEGASAAMRRK